MKLARLIAAVVAGYLVAAIANSAWVLYWYMDGETETSAVLVGLTFVMFATSGLVTGLLVGWVAGAAGRVASLAAAALLALVGVANIALGSAIEPQWHTMLAILVQAPAVVLGARLGAPARERT